MKILTAAIGLAALAVLMAPTAQACDMHGFFDDSYYSYGERQLTEEEARKAEQAAAEAREIAMANAREAFLARFAIKADDAAAAPAAPTQTSANLDADRRTRTDPSYR